MTNIAVDFGPIITGTSVRNAVMDTIKYWSPTYIGEMARRDGQPGAALPVFRSYPDSFDGSTYPEEQIPACVLTVPGITRRPEKTGKGKIRAQWAVGLGIVVAGPTKSRTIELAEMYTAAVRMIMLQKKSLDAGTGVSFAMGTEWISEHFTDPMPKGARTMVGGILAFGVDVDNVADVSQGPNVPVPSADTSVGWPTVATPSMGVTGFPITEEVLP